MESKMFHLVAGMCVLLLLFPPKASSSITMPTFNDRQEKKLMSELLSKYGPTSVRPVKNHSVTSEVFFRLLPKELISFNEAKQQITVLHFMRMMWTDENLTWDPNDYGGVNITTVKPSEVWRPDISLYENAQKEFISIQETFILVSYTGFMDWYFPAYVTSLCKVDITYFPYDVQVCNVSFGPWSYMKHMVHFQLSRHSDTTMDIFNQNGVWVLERSVGFNSDAVMCCDNRTWSMIRYEITIRRMSMFYTKTVVVPALLFTMLMAVVCCLHPASGEKVTLAVSNLLALILFQQLVADRMPPSGETTSIIVNFFIAMIAICCAEVLSAIFVLRIYHMGGQTEIPWLLRRIMLCPIILPLYGSGKSKKIMMTQQANDKNRRKTRVLENFPDHIGSSNIPGGLNSKASGQHSARGSSDLPVGRHHGHENNGRRVNPGRNSDNALCDRINPETIAETWRQLAIVIDKLMFILSLLVTVAYWVYMIVSFSCHF